MAENKITWRRGKRAGRRFGLPQPKSKKGWALALALGLAFSLLAALALFVCIEWIQRGTLKDVYEKFYLYHKRSYQMSFLLVWLVYLAAAALFRRHAAAVLATAALGLVPAAVSWFKLSLRAEPFFPWDLAQAGEAMDVAGAAGLKMNAALWGSLGAVALLFFVSLLLPLPRLRLPARLAAALAPLAGAAALVVGVFLAPSVSQGWLGVTPDMWYQARYYRWYGFITGFLTNIQNLEIAAPQGYSEAAVKALVDQVQAGGQEPLFPAFTQALATGAGESATYSQAAAAAFRAGTKPDIIYVMDESFWDAGELTSYGVAFSEPLTPNLDALRRTSAYGKVYSPSFGGGTCDVEFEALTGCSMLYLPAGCKPFQQHVTRPMFSLPNHLKTLSYRTAAVHGYYKKFWSRLTAYPNLGLDTFVGLDDMKEPEKKRGVYWTGGLVSDAEMARQTVSLYEELLGEGEAPVFVHAVTMQNHTSYDPRNYADSERVRVLEAPAAMTAEARGALEDFATGVQEADAMLGTLTRYFAAQDRPVILAFWGDHYNPIGSGMNVFTSTGYASADKQDPRVHEMPLLIWSNFSSAPLSFGTVGSYELSPLVGELYGLDQPVFFRYLIRQLQQGYRSLSLGVIVPLAGEAGARALTAEEKAWEERHWLLQYDLMFGKGYALAAAGEALP